MAHTVSHPARTTLSNNPPLSHADCNDQWVCVLPNPHTPATSTINTACTQYKQKSTHVEPTTAGMHNLWPPHEQANTYLPVHDAHHGSMVAHLQACPSPRQHQPAQVSCNNSTVRDQSTTTAAVNDKLGRKPMLLHSTQHPCPIPTTAGNV